VSRMLVVLVIVLGVAFGVGGFAYWYTSKHPEILAETPSSHPPGPPPPTTPQAAALIPAADVAGDDAPPAPPSFAKEAPMAFSDAIKAFSYKSEHIVWVLPPGMHAKGPFNADVTVKHGDDVVFHQSIPLVADYPAPGSKAQYPRSAEIVRLSADDSWPKEYSDILAAMADTKAKFGGGAVNITSGFQLNFDPETKANFCSSGSMPDVRVFLEDANAPLLKPLDIAGAAPLLAQAMFTGCK